MKLLWIVCVFFLSLPIVAQHSDWFLQEVEELEVQRIDIRSIGVGVVGRFFQDDLIDFQRGGNDIQVIQDTEEEGQGGIQLSFRYGLDNYIFPGISLGLKFDYIYADVNDVQLTILDGGNVDFEFDGAFFVLHSFSFVPNIELSVFSLIENIFRVNLNQYWDIYLYGGIRSSINIYNEDGDLDDDNLELENLETFVWGYEAGLGVEVFFNYFWSLKFEFSYSNQTSDFELFEGDVLQADADLDLTISKWVIGVNYYF